MKTEKLLEKLLKDKTKQPDNHSDIPEIPKTSHCGCKRKADLETLYKKYDIKGTSKKDVPFIVNRANNYWRPQ